MYSDKSKGNNRPAGIQTDRCKYTPYGIIHDEPAKVAILMIKADGSSPAQPMTGSWLWLSHTKIYMENKNKIYDPRGAGRFLSLQDKKKHMKVGSRDRPIKGNGQGRLSARERSPERSPSVPAKRATRITPRAPSSTARKREPSSRVRGHSSERL